MRIRLTAPASLLLLLPVAGAAHAGIKLVYERAHDGQTSTNTLSFEKQNLRMDGIQAGPRGQGGDGSILFDAERKVLTMIDPSQKVYRELNEEDAKAMKAQMAQMRAMMAERLKTVPPEQRAQAEATMNMLGGGGELPPLKYQSLGQKKKVAGYDCEVYRVSMGARVLSESCFAPWSSQIVTKAEAEELKKTSTALQTLMAFMPAARQQDWTQIPGVPVEETHFGPDGKTKQWTNVLKSVSRAPLPADTFKVPAGYRKEEIPKGPGMGPGGMGPGPRPGMGPGGPKK